MKNLKSLFFRIPEIYLLLAVGYYWTLTPAVLNPVAITLIVLLLVQLVINKQVTGIILGSIFASINVLMFLALFSEFSEFPAGDKEGMNLLVWGSVYFGVNVLMSGIMLVKYAVALPVKDQVSISS